MSTLTSQEYRESKPLFNRGRIGWGLFDWANQGFTTIIITFIFGSYFDQGIVNDGAQGQILWGQTIGWSAVLIALSAPFLGSVAELGGRRKPWVLGFAFACIVLTVGLFFMLPDRSYIWAAMVLVIFANLFYELSIVFNNAMLADMVDGKRIARLGGIAWSGGYFGGLICLFLCLLFAMEIVVFDGGPGFEFRVSALIVAAWFAVFLIPFILWTPDKAATGRPFGEMLLAGPTRLGRTALTLVLNHRNILWFLIGRMAYMDGVNAIIAMGAVFARAKYGLDLTGMIMVGVLLNVFAGVGGVVFALFEDRLGSKVVIMISVVGFIVVSVAALLSPSFALFLLFGCIMGIFLGPVQQASRTMMAKLAPADLQGDLFGLYAFTGKATSMLAPWLIAFVTAWALSVGVEDLDARTIGMFGVVPFMVIGFVIMLFVKGPKSGGDS